MSVIILLEIQLLKVKLNKITIKYRGNTENASKTKIELPERQVLSP